MSISENELFSHCLGRPLRHKLQQDTQDLILKEQLQKAYNQQLKQTNVWKSDKRVYKLVGSGMFDKHCERVSPRKFRSI